MLRNYFLFVIGVIAFFAALPYGLHDYIMSLVDVFGVLEYSWAWLFDFIVIAIFIVISYIFIV